MSLPVPAVSESIQSYMSDINLFPILSREEEYRLAVRYKKEGDLESAHKLVVSNLKLVVKIALEHRGYGCSTKDLIQEGNIGLMTAVKKFDPDKGYRLITYAAWWIRTRIQEFIIRSRSLVRRGTRALKEKLFYRNGSGSERGPSPGPDLSLNTPVAGPYSTELVDTTHQDMLREAGPGQEETLSLAQEHAIARREVQTALACLNDKERLIIETRVMAEEPATLQRLGEMLGLTRERVRQIENAALKKLKKKMVDEGSCISAQSRAALH